MSSLVVLQTPLDVVVREHDVCVVQIPPEYSRGLSDRYRRTDIQPDLRRKMFRFRFLLNWVVLQISKFGYVTSTWTLILTSRLNGAISPEHTTPG